MRFFEFRPQARLLRHSDPHAQKATRSHLRHWRSRARYRRTRDLGGFRRFPFGECLHAKLEAGTHPPRLPHAGLDPAFINHLVHLQKSKPVIFCGDMNVAHQEIDLARPKDNTRNAGFTIEEREAFDQVLNAGFIDTFRHFEPKGGNYTWWSYQHGAREKNIGWRIDYFCASASMASSLKSAFIQPEVTGSDHCPVGLVIDA